jgi:hypothetical protein
MMVTKTKGSSRSATCTRLGPDHDRAHRQRPAAHRTLLQGVEAESAREDVCWHVAQRPAYSDLYRPRCLVLLLLKYLPLQATFGWSLSNLIALLPMNFFAYRDPRSCD